jgi:hypothetical protein
LLAAPAISGALVALVDEEARPAGPTIDALPAVNVLISPRPEE